MSGSADKRAWQIGWKLAPGHSNLVAAVAARAADTVFHVLSANTARGTVWKP